MSSCCYGLLADTAYTAMYCSHGLTRTSKVYTAMASADKALATVSADGTQREQDGCLQGSKQHKAICQGIKSCGIQGQTTMLSPHLHLD